MQIKPTLTSLRAFDLFARTGTLTEAATVLNVTRPAISKQIKELETITGCQLVSRAGPNVTLTAQGAELAAGLRQAFDLISATTERLTESDLRSDSVRVLVERDFASSWLAEKIGTFLIDHPGISVEIIAERNGRLRNAEDFSFRIFYGPQGSFESTDLTEEFLCDWIDIPLCTPEYAARHISDGGQYQDARFLLDKNYNPWDQWFEKAGIGSPGESAAFTSFNETSLCLSAALSDAGITIGDSFLCLHSIETGRLIAPFKIGSRSTERYAICRPSGRKLSASELKFKQWLVREIEEFEKKVDRVIRRKGIKVI
ncbi:MULTISPECIES: LysR family transcriptional regulator [unclassified Ruegeria]|uniref:LysR family transcriptional regulator n=1 Tax=unclassified Ruegeria TaxID=2625375 RepID=UPI001AE8BA79|nr:MULTISPECIES: LysR family transcriptional regulator [unclassified Ruegeria]